MILPILKFGDPTLRRKGARIESITPEITQLIADMFETMREAAGVGLAAQQVGRELQLTVLDVRGVTDRPSIIEWDGRPAEVDASMPMVLINPELKLAGEPVMGPEGCLSFPEIYEEIARPPWVDVSALDAQGKRIQFRAGGLLGRAIQHEVDHLNGILFIDRMSVEAKKALKSDLDNLQSETKAVLQKTKEKG